MVAMPSEGAYAMANSRPRKNTQRMPWLPFFSVPCAGFIVSFATGILGVTAAATTPPPSLLRSICIIYYA